MVAVFKILWKECIPLGEDSRGFKQIASDLSPTSLFLLMSLVYFEKNAKLHLGLGMPSWGDCRGGSSVGKGI